jgi:hypothetical protein
MSKDNLTLGRGKIYFAPFKTGTKTLGGGERYLGSTKSMSITPSKEELTHSNMEGGRVFDDKKVITKENDSISFSCEDISQENTAMFFSAETKTTAYTSAAEVSVFDSVEGGLFYQLGATSLRLTGAREITSLVVTGGNPVATYIKGTDYEVDLGLGRIEILATGNIPVDTEITCSFNQPIQSIESVSSGENSVIEGQLRFIADNAVGDNKDYLWPYVSLVASGAFELKGNDWQSLPFAASVMRLNSTTPSVIIEHRANII